VLPLTTVEGECELNMSLFEVFRSLGERDKGGADLAERAIANAADTSVAARLFAAIAGGDRAALGELIRR
jgi:hypothetical protein